MKRIKEILNFSGCESVADVVLHIWRELTGFYDRRIEYRLVEGDDE